eukprot:gnl/TRDRNA2_/TRDRNA2_149765_c2_seq1.p1 gnl/TRDRNA2_/TRDRNA2_149765_c2~~gnl/TRDRNA2_/TRDRNA2_149765_c2_seq1.p1  ORF type:complete len:184 (+),score=27.01 gnl/TRDRNA2_/TRDRNA2_149765_c2_seq1:28-552(+)
MGTQSFLVNGSDSCSFEHRNERICYRTEYEAKKQCLGRQAKSERVKGRNMSFTTLRDDLRNQAPLSTFLKMDIEGWEWAVLDELLKSREQVAKIRTLDLEAHLNRSPEIAAEQGRTNGHTNLKEDNATLEKKVEIMENITEHFAVVGSTIESQHRSHSGLVQYSISFVNRQLLI